MGLHNNKQYLSVIFLTVMRSSCLSWHNLHEFKKLNIRESNLGVYNSMENMPFSNNTYSVKETTKITVFIYAEKIFMYANPEIAKKFIKIGYIFIKCPLKLK